MRTYQVEIPIRIYVTIEVEAENAQEASEAIEDIDDYIFHDAHGGIAISDRLITSINFNGNDSCLWDEVSVTAADGSDDDEEEEEEEESGEWEAVDVDFDPID